MSASLLEELESPTVRPGPRCTVAQLLDRLERGDEAQRKLAADLQVVLHPDSNANCEEASRRLKARNIRIAGGTLSRHRRSACACDR